MTKDVLDTILRHPFGGPLAVATLMLVLVWTSKAAGRAFEWCRAEYRRAAVRRELQDSELERRRLNAVAILPERPWGRS